MADEPANAGQQTTDAVAACDLTDAYRTIAEHERQQDEACRAEIEAVLAKYGRRLQITQPQIHIVPT
ncbi:hypothetical protein [Streptomyces cadmiisoli]|uniref:hypothetical protein n=1 Tax=Streptomyces cadmiisoli TaxID=2184053 RepID=UPI00364D3C5E